MNTLDRCLAYLEKLPTAVSGSGGHKATLQAALACRRFGLSDAEMWQAMTWFNENRCSPAWSEKDLKHKLASVADMPITKPLGQPVGRKPTIKPVTASELAALSTRQHEHRALLAKAQPLRRPPQAADEAIAMSDSEPAAVVETGTWHTGEPPEPPPALAEFSNTELRAELKQRDVEVWDGAVVAIADLPTFRARYGLSVVGGDWPAGELRPRLIVEWIGP